MNFKMPTIVRTDDMKLACAYSESSNKSVHQLRCDQSRSFPPDKMLDPLLPTERLGIGCSDQTVLMRRLI